jgi:hypothetical protein
MADFLNALIKTDQLPRTVIYSLNPSVVFFAIKDRYSLHFVHILFKINSILAHFSDKSFYYHIIKDR